MRWSDDLLRGLGTEDMDLLIKAGDAFSGYTEYATRVIEDRRGCPRDDLMSILVHAEVDGDRLDDDSILHESLLILIGGDETTRHVMSGGAYQLLVPTRAVAASCSPDRDLIVPAVEEMLRWVTPIKNMARTATAHRRVPRQDHRGRAEAAAALPVGQPRRRPLPRPVHLRHRTRTERPRGVRLRHALLPRQLARPPRAAGAVRACCSTACPISSWSTPPSPRHRAANFVSGYEGMKVAFTPTPGALPRRNCRCTRDPSSPKYPNRTIRHIIGDSAALDRIVQLGAPTLSLVGQEIERLVRREATAAGAGRPRRRVPARSPASPGGLPAGIVRAAVRADPGSCRMQPYCTVGRPSAEAPRPRMRTHGAGTAPSAPASRPSAHRTAAVNDTWAAGYAIAEPERPIPTQRVDQFAQSPGSVHNRDSSTNSRIVAFSRRRGW